MPLRTLDLVNPKESLIVFDRFWVDDKLPKNIATSRAEIFSSGFVTTVTSGTANSSIVVTGNTVFQSSFSGEKTRGWLSKVLRWLKAKLKPETVVPVTQVFARIKASTQELAEWEARDQVLEELLTRSKTAGQHDLVKRLEAERVVRQFENALYVKGRRKLLTEAQLLEFTDECEKGLCLDWVRDFLRPIPPEVVAEKAKCDEDHLFDNYVVLHFDPKNRGTSPEARAKAKDPILFGVIKGSRKLYFVGDWQDELCDLTFQEIIDTLGKSLVLPEDPTAHALEAVQD